MNKISINNNFDILRLILAILVFFAHWNILTSQELSNPLFHLSEYAVDLFFVVSGFLIFWSFDADQNKKHFYIKRFFRIFPLYAFLIILQTLFFIGFSDGNALEIIKYFLVNIFFLNFLAPAVGSTLSGLEVNAINGSLWTLKNEVIFYALVPLIFMLYKKYGVCFLWILYFSYSFYILHFPVIQLFLYFGINPSNPQVSFVVLFAVILVLSYFSEIYIENRFVKIGKEIVKRDRLK